MKSTVTGWIWQACGLVLAVVACDVRAHAPGGASSESDADTATADAAGLRDSPGAVVTSDAGDGPLNGDAPQADEAS